MWRGIGHAAGMGTWKKRFFASFGPMRIGSNKVS
jgi:hypothetical protein